MIYLDVTSACQSALNTGVKRIQRAMHIALAHRPDYQPLYWQSAQRAYRPLQPGDLAILTGVTPRNPRGWALIDSFAPGAISDWYHLARDSRISSIDPNDFRQEDVLLVPDLLWDNRGTFLERLGRYPLRRIGIFHDAIALRLPRQSRLDRYFCRRGVRALAHLDGVLCISREAEADLQRYWKEEGLEAVPTQVALWPVPFNSPRPDNTSNFAAKRLLMVARLEPHKNHLRLLAACDVLWREGLAFDLHLIGCMAYPDTAWKILRRVRELQRQGRAIKWQAHVSDPDLHLAYRACSATVFPSLLEGFGLPILESVWHGRPVICGGTGALGEVAAGGGCEIVDPGSLPNLTEGLRRILTKSSRYEELYAETQNRTFRTWEDYWREIAGFVGGSFTA